MIKKAFIFLVFPFLGFAGPLDNLKPGEWYEVPGSNLAAHTPTPEPATANGVGVKSVISGWSGGAFDVYRDRLIVWGGGHFAYSGNEIYVFDLIKLEWERVNQPSHFPDYNYAALGWVNGQDEAYPDGRPVSRHTYDNLAFIPPPVDRFFSNGGSALYSASFGDTTTWMYDFKTDTWEAKVHTAQSGLGDMTEYNPVTKTVFTRAGGSGKFNLWEYLPGVNTWKKHAGEQSGVGIRSAAAIDAKRNLFVMTGGGQAYFWDLGQTQASRVAYSASGSNGVAGASNPGFVYDPVADKFVGWNGGATVYTLDWEAKSWATVSAASTNTVTPTAALGSGTFDRFAYSPRQNVFVVVNSISENVFIYKHTAAASAPQWFLDLYLSDTASLVITQPKKQSSKPGLRAYPNPFRGVVSFQLPGVSEHARTLTILNAQGRTVKKIAGSRHKPETALTWDASHLPAGVYVARLKMENRVIEKKLFLSH